MTKHSLTETETRQTKIDIQLKKAGWSDKQRNILEELPLIRNNPKISELQTGYQASREYADYALLGQNGKPIAIVEAKRTSRDPLVGERQACDYADLLQDQYGVDPFIFLSNGEEIWFLDRARYPIRKVSGFYSLDDLERLDFQRQYAVLPSSISPGPKIIDRSYQIEAIKRVAEGIENKQRKFLLVMATGTGKTRTVIALIEILFRARVIQRVLFLADRRELVRQALGAFKEYMPNQSRERIEGGRIENGARIHVATYPSMMQIYQKLSPGYYDLIIADESHRSIYNRYKALLDHFDAFQIGLTATPTDYIEHNTFNLFNCPDGLPTFYYPYEEAVNQSYLADYKVLEAKTRFQIEGIKAGELPPELQRLVDEQGIELSEINFEGTDLERRVTNTGTNDAIVDEFMANCRKDATGTLPAKAIIFAMTHAHAMELYNSFNRRYPALQARGLARVIDSHMERTDKTLDDFKNEEKMPRVAISVDMLDTGIDVPAIQNLVFAKPVFSQVKFWQMIGRGTRLWTDPHTRQQKRDFLILDFWENFAYFQMNPQGEVAKPTEALPVRLFRLRLEKLLLLLGQHQQNDADRTIASLQAMIAALPVENVNIRPHLEELKGLENADAWTELNPEKVKTLQQGIAPLMRFLPDVNLQVMTFEARTENLAVQYLQGNTDQVEQIREKVIRDLGLLPDDLPEIAEKAQTIAWVNSEGFWQHLDYRRVMDLQSTFAPLMRFRIRERQDIIRLNLPDQIASRYWISYGPAGEGAFVETYRQQVEDFVLELAEQHPALRKLSRDEPLTESEIQSIVDALNRPDLFITEENLRQAYDQPEANLLEFLRHILKVSQLPEREQVIKDAFAKFLSEHPRFRASQVQFLRVIEAAVLSRNRITTEALRLPPFSRAGQADRLFTPGELDEILRFVNQFAVTEE